MLEHPIEIVHYVAVCHPDNPETFGSEPFRPALVIGRLARVAVAIDLDNQLCVRAEEVGDEWAEPDLPPKLGAVQLPRSKAGPKLSFGWRRVAACLAGA